ncbi:MAG: IS3 family transposase [Schaalia turicensis]
MGSHRRYGYRRVRVELKGRWIRVSGKLVLKLIRSMNLMCRVRVPKKDSSYKERHAICAISTLKSAGRASDG